MHSSTATLAAVLAIAPLLAKAAVTYTFEAAPNGGEIANAYAVSQQTTLSTQQCLDYCTSEAYCIMAVTDQPVEAGQTGCHRLLYWEGQTYTVPANRYIYTKVVSADPEPEVDPSVPGAGASQLAQRRRRNLARGVRANVHSTPW